MVSIFECSIYKKVLYLIIYNLYRKPTQKVILRLIFKEQNKIRETNSPKVTKSVREELSDTLTQLCLIPVLTFFSF